MPIVNRIADLHGEITAWRRDIHAHPELLYDVHRTAGVGRREAQELRLRRGGDRHRPHRRGRRDPRRQGRRARKVIGLRADMDALPIEEANDLPYKSTVPGKMHACGHDGHTAMLLGAAQLPRRDAQLRRHRGGDLPAGRGGRRRRPGDGAGRPDGALRHRGSLRHAQLSRAAGRRVRDPAGPADGGRRPHRRSRSKASAGTRRGRISSIDTVLVGAQIINQIQSIVARNVDPLQAAVISICMFQAGTTDNVIPQTAHSARHRAQPDAGGARPARSGACTRWWKERRKLYGATAKLTYKRDYPVTAQPRAARPRSRPRSPRRWSAASASTPTWRR